MDNMGTHPNNLMLILCSVDLCAIFFFFVLFNLQSNRIITSTSTCNEHPGITHFIRKEKAVVGKCGHGFFSSLFFFFFFLFLFWLKNTDCSVLIRTS